MTDEQINAAIAEACGWTQINVQHRSGISPTNGLRMGAEFLPKYCTDLNAMHAAEKVLVGHGDNRFGGFCIYLTNYNITLLGLEAAIHATARQRAEAFLRTLGKWEDVQG